MKEMKLSTIAAIACFVLGGASCSNEENLYDPEAIAQKRVEEYGAAFEKVFGKVAANHNWGFSDAVAQNGRSRANCFKPDEPGYYNNVEPVSDITDEERDLVMAEFAKKHNADESVVIKWSDFHVQYVGKSNKEYTTEPDQNGCTQKITGSGQMQRLVVKDRQADKYEHVNDFNAEAGKTVFVYNSTTEGTKAFGYSNNLDNGYDYYDYIILEINGSYYVGFDYKCDRENAKVLADNVYDDWVVKIVPAVYKNTKRIMAEDLGTIGDFDFNDVVFDVAVNSKNLVITLQAAGGTLPLYVAGKEVHDLFGVDVKTMVNTQGKNNKAPVIFRTGENIWDMTADVLKGIEIKVEGTNAVYVLDAESGKAPQKICVDSDCAWSSERVRIDERYPKFKEYVEKPEVEFWK